jgi:AcrR family transcriptional regulator
VKAASDLDDDTIPAWQRQSMHRSLQSARARAHARSHRFVTAAIQLLQEKGSTDFTVQDVVERSRMSIRTFYKYFASKDDLLVAVFETIVGQDAVPRLKRSIAKFKDPLARLRAYIETLVELGDRTEVRAARTLTNYEYRLAETRPADLDRAMRPQFELLRELIQDVARTRPLRRDLTIETAARLTHYTVLAAVHNRVRGSEGAADVPARAIYQYCLAGLGFDAKTPRS